MDFIKKNLTLSSPVKRGCGEFGVEGDIIVPDVLPDILKVVQVDGAAVLQSAEVSDGKLVCEGRLDLKILYIPEDESSKIKSITTSFDFTHTPSNSAPAENYYTDISVDVTKVDFHLTNSRKMKIKSVVAVNYSFMATETINIATEPEDENMFEIRKKAAKVCSFVDFKDTQFLVRESLEIPAGQSSVCDLLKVDATVCDTEFKVISGRVVIKGVCGICALYTDSANCVRYSDFEVPFTEIVELENAEEDTVLCIDYCVKEVNYRAEADSDGDVRIIVADVIVGAKISAWQEVELDYIEDCYCPGKRINVEKQMRQIECILSKGAATTTLREVIACDRNAPNLSGIYSLVAKPVVESAKAENGRVCVEGKVICYCLYVCGGDDVPVYSLKHEIRFCENIEAEGCTTGCDCKVRAEITHKNYALNSAGETELKISLLLDAVMTKTADIPLISVAQEEEVECESKKGIVIYFVGEGDTLWEVSKRYTVPMSSVAELNGLETEHIEKGMKLLIPSV